MSARDWNWLVDRMENPRKPNAKVLPSSATKKAKRGELVLPLNGSLDRQDFVGGRHELADGLRRVAGHQDKGLPTFKLSTASAEAELS